MLQLSCTPAILCSRSPWLLFSLNNFCCGRCRAKILDCRKALKQLKKKCFDRTKRSEVMGTLEFCHTFV